jgi:hypothetical protein
VQVSARAHRHMEDLAQLSAMGFKVCVEALPLHSTGGTAHSQVRCVHHWQLLYPPNKQSLNYSRAPGPVA